jgi:hypothetical protein
LVSRDPARLSIAEVLGLWADPAAAPARLARALSVPALSATWRGRFARRFAASTGGTGPLEWSHQKLTWLEDRGS